MAGGGACPLEDLTGFSKPVRSEVDSGPHREGMRPEGPQGRQVRTLGPLASRPPLRIIGAEHTAHESDVLLFVDGRVAIANVLKLIRQQIFNLVPFAVHNGARDIQCDFFVLFHCLALRKPSRLSTRSNVVSCRTRCVGS